MAVIRKQTRTFSRGLPRRARCFATRAARRSPKASSRLHRLLDDGEPAREEPAYARRYGYGDLVVPPGLVMAVVFSQSVEDISENARANLEYIDMRFGVPVCVGDTLEAETLVLGVKARRRTRRSASCTCRPPAATSTARSCSRSSARCRSGRRTSTRRSPTARPRRATSSTYARDPGLRCDAATASSRTLSSPDTYFEDFTRRRRLRAHARPRGHDRPHHADGHARQHVAGALQPVDGDRSSPSATSAAS